MARCKVLLEKWSGNSQFWVYEVTGISKKIIVYGIFAVSTTPTAKF